MEGLPLSGPAGEALPRRRGWLTLLLIALNVLVFLAMLLSGSSLFSPGLADLLRWGASYSPRVTAGQGWRLFTCIFVHIGLIHLAFNMAVLWSIGSFMERFLGRAAFLVVYLLTGLAGSVASLWWNPFVVSAGASGAIFGLYGVLLGMLLADRGVLDRSAVRGLSRSALTFVGYNLVFGFLQSGIDMAAHLGGLVSGFICGLILAGRLGPQGIRGWGRTLQLAFGGLLVLALAAYTRPRTPDLQGALEAFFQAESHAVESYNAAVDKAKRGELGDGAFADELEGRILPGWRAARVRLESLSGLPARQEAQVDPIRRYAEARERAWELFAEALRTEDPAKAKEAMGYQREAEGILKDSGHGRK
nr:rhomboid family intramembrane serine protease [uncultured Holophaga sp.]